MEVCADELREFRMKWDGTDTPKYLNWYVSEEINPTDNDLYDTGKDILLDGTSAGGYGVGTEKFVLTAEAYDDPNVTPQRYANVMDVIYCQDDGDSQCPSGETYNEATGMCEPDTGGGSEPGTN